MTVVVGKIPKSCKCTFNQNYCEPSHLNSEPVHHLQVDESKAESKPNASQNNPARLIHINIVVADSIARASIIICNCFVCWNTVVHDIRCIRNVVGIAIILSTWISSTFNYIISCCINAGYSAIWWFRTIFCANAIVKVICEILKSCSNVGDVKNWVVRCITETTNNLIRLDRCQHNINLTVDVSINCHIAHTAEESNKNEQEKAVCALSVLEGTLLNWNVNMIVFSLVASVFKFVVVKIVDVFCTVHGGGRHNLLSLLLYFFKIWS